MQEDQNSEAAHYTPASIERKWQEAWSGSEVFSTPEPSDEHPDRYVFVTPPFTSGDAHMGHVRSYVIGDTYARYRRSRGDAILFSLGFDAFGLPAEMSAIERDMNPRNWVEECCAKMRHQFESLGLSFDWSRTFVSSDPDIYRWSQWLFIRLFELDLVYLRDAQVDWCATCRTVLAGLQVEDGCCWRCHKPVSLIRKAQWYLRLSAYNEENDKRLTELRRWNKPAIGAQRAVLGRVDGAELPSTFADGFELAVFTVFPEAIAHATFVAISPNHPDLDRMVGYADKRHKLDDMQRRFRAQSARGIKHAPVVALGLSVHVPVIDRWLPVVVSPAVDLRAGPTALLGIPAVDEVDGVIAERLAIPAAATDTNRASVAFGAAVRYRACDFPISRQRAWGAPIPLVKCGFCGTIPVPLEQLPVRLPDDLSVTGEGNGLRDHPDFVKCTCPKCGGPAERETDTLDCHMDAAWTAIPLTVPPTARSKSMFRHPDARRWLPVDQLIKGADTGSFMLDMRMMAKALRDLGELDFLYDGEPYAGALMHGMVQLEGRKMSKHIGNTVTPQELVSRLGADAVRFAILYAIEPARNLPWNDETEHVLDYCAAFLRRLWHYAELRLSAEDGLSDDATIDVSDVLRSDLASSCESAVRAITADLEVLKMHRATREIIAMFTRIVDFEKRALRMHSTLEDEDRAAIAIALMLLLRLLSPISPHISEELWQRAGRKGFLSGFPWPEDTKRPLAASTY